MTDQLATAIICSLVVGFFAGFFAGDRRTVKSPSCDHKWPKWSDVQFTGGQFLVGSLGSITHWQERICELCGEKQTVVRRGEWK